MKDIIQSKLANYQCQTSDEEENALKEISQEVILYGLSKSGFFKEANFQGGTCLRIVHGMRRFSEDLDFALTHPNKSYDIESYIAVAKPIINSYGFNIEISGSDNPISNMRTRFLKDDSIKLQLNFNHHANIKKKIKIKVEVDTNPPDGANTTSSFLDFPQDFAIRTHDLPSLFAGKCHALLCRDYTKGRDWYDFLWYTAHKTTINYRFLSAALNQTGPWKGKGIEVDATWVKKALSTRIKEIKWSDAVLDISKFIQPSEVDSLKLWQVDFFAAKIGKIS